MIYSKFFVIASAALVAASLAFPAAASDRRYFKSIEGQWSGPGSIVAGKYKGTRFSCDFNGIRPKQKTGMKIAGSCRVGVFSQPMSIEIAKIGRSYRGKFLDGAEGKGLDIVSGRLQGHKLVVGINRKKLNGAMVANMRGKNQMTITISVKVQRQLVPVIGLTLNRKARIMKTSLVRD
jgi:hypothetical protein